MASSPRLEGIESCQTPWGDTFLLCANNCTGCKTYAATAKTKNTACFMTSKYYTPPKCGLAARPLLLICNNIKISEITQAQVKKNEAGEVVEVYCEYDPNTKSGMPEANRKVKGTLHWVSCDHCLEAEVRLYDRLWKVENPRDELTAIREAKNCDALEAMKDIINPDSLNILPHCYIEKYAAGMKPLTYLQFQRIGYFNVDPDSTPEKMVFNRTVGLKDTWGKINK